MKTMENTILIAHNFVQNRAVTFPQRRDDEMCFLPRVNSTTTDLSKNKKDFEELHKPRENCKENGTSHFS